MVPLKVIAFSGSLRKGSYNRLLLQKLVSFAPSEVTVDIFDISSIPLYNEDVEIASYPEAVIDFKNRIRSADSIIIVTPEYNYSIPGVLKNALDWASRPPTDIPFISKPGAILGTSISQFGSVRSQLHLRQVLFALGVRLMNTPEIYVPKAKDLFLTGDLTDERTLMHLQKFWPSYISWVELCK
jgi:chromate reductase, NAD(P)H dehydrogenase (quinone)